MSFYKKNPPPKNTGLRLSISPDTIALLGYAIISTLWLIKFIFSNLEGNLLELEVLIGILYATAIIAAAATAAINKSNIPISFGIIISIGLITSTLIGGYNYSIDGVFYYGNLFLLEPVLPVRLLNLSNNFSGGIKTLYILYSSTPLIIFLAAFLIRKFNQK